MKTIRHISLIAFFAGLVILEIWHGLSRLGAIARREREAALSAARIGLEDLARNLAGSLGAGREHARYLRKMPGVRALLASPAGSPLDRSSRSRLQEDLSPYLITFSVIDRLSLFDAGGRERFRLIRLMQRPESGGVGSIPAELLDGALPAAGPPSSPAPVGEDDGDGITLSRLEIDPGRVEVPRDKRQVLRYTAEVRDGEARLGTLALTLYAAPLLDAVEGWRPWAGVLPALIDSEGRRLSRSGTASGEGLDPRALGAILGGRLEARAGSSLYLAAPITPGGSGWRLVAEVPDAALEAAILPIRGEHAWVVATMAAVLLILVAGGAFFLRLSIREVRLAESARYLDRVRRESARYRALMEGAADMILIVSPADGRIREANALARAALGLPGPEAMGDALLLEAFVHPAHRALVRSKLGSASTGAAADLPEIRLLGAGRGEIPASGRLALIELAEERVVEVALRDLTRERELERQVRISERLGSLGLLTAGVAHEINNPLEGIENYLALLEREGGEGAKRARYVEMVRYGFRRIRDLVRDLSSFARPEMKQAEADLAGVVERALGMVRYDRSFRGVEVERIGLEGPIPVLGDPGRLEQVFINLLVNAARAMKGEGKIAIVARETGSGQGEGGVEVSVEDTGPGIPEEILGKIFDPFFTTGDGSGLGLSISYGIVRAHGGELRAENRPGGGARFAMRLVAAKRVEAGARREG